MGAVFRDSMSCAQSRELLAVGHEVRLSTHHSSSGCAGCQRGVRTYWRMAISGDLIGHIAHHTIAASPGPGTFTKPVFQARQMH